jgi:DnaB-like helicase C terminal domain
MSHQLALCYRVIKTHDIAPVLNFGITVDDFVAPEAKALWGSIITYYTDPRTAGSIPDATLLSVRHNTVFNLGDDMPGTTLDGLCAEVRRQRVATEGNKAAVKFSESLATYKSDPMGPLAQLQAEITRLMALGTTANTDVSLLQGARNIRQRIEWARQGVDFSKMTWPWDPLQKGTFGIRPDDYIVFYGRPKSMKTWILAYLIAWAFWHEKRVLVYTKEMTPDNVYMRALACILRLHYQELRGAMMSQAHPMSVEDEMRLCELIRQLEESPTLATFIMVASGREVGPGLDTVTWLRSKVEKYKPDLTIVDGLYLLSDHRKHTSDHQRVMNISRDLRDMVLGTNNPLIATMQANRKAEGNKDANGSEIAYSDALAQDTTMYARVIADKETPTISLVIGGSREFSLHGMRINAVPATDFSYHSELFEKDIKKALEGDVGEDEKKDGKEAKEAKKAKRSGDKKPADTHARDLNDQFGIASTQ